MQCGAFSRYAGEHVIGHVFHTECAEIMAQPRNLACDGLSQNSKVIHAVAAQRQDPEKP
jgi:hypothetical protein